MQPHASELEEAIIGACLIEQEALPLVADKLRPEMFYDDHHQLIFAALIAMYQANKKIDILTVKEELTRRGVLEKIGGPYTIVQLSSRVASSAHIEYHAQIVHQKYLAREAVVGFNKSSPAPWMRQSTSTTPSSTHTTCSTVSKANPDTTTIYAAWTP